MLQIERQVCSFGLSVELQKVGVKQIASFYWTENKELISFGQLPFIRKDTRVYAAYTIAEMGQMLPHNIEGFSFRIIKEQLLWLVQYSDELKGKYSAQSAKMADAIGRVLHYVAQDKLINKNFLQAA